MINPEAIKLQLVQDIINMPDDLLPLLRDFLADLDNQDPAPNLIGRAGHDPATKSLDEELYGETKAPDD